MKKRITKKVLGTILTFACTSIYAQQIQFDEQLLPVSHEVIPPQIFEGVQYSSIAFADVNNDGNQDVLITGQDAFGQFITKLYTNDGTGNFTEVLGTPFEGVYAGSIAFADVNNDGNQDVLITGYSDFGLIAKLYTNDGTGNFTEVAGTPFEGVVQSSIAFADVNNDGNQDVLITGYGSYQPIAKLYTNDGTGNFTEVLGTPFEGVVQSSIAFADVNNDGNQDVLITGYGSYQPISKLYTNDGTGNFTEATLPPVTENIPFEGIHLSCVAFADVDSDGDQDVLITGQNSFNQHLSKLYINDGNGSFTEISTPFEGVRESSVAFSDVDSDGDQDVLITGMNSYSQRIAKLYINDGLGTFVEKSGTPFEGVYTGSIAIAFSDVDNDGDQDVLITGANSSNQPTSSLYINDGSGNFTEVSTPFEGVFHSCVAFSDINGDGFGDVLITGYNGSQCISKLYINDGSGNFTEVSAPFEGVSYSFIAFSDVDNDGDQDVLITGVNSSNQRIAKLYINDGSGSFTEVSTPFEGVAIGSVTFSDVDNDGDQDVLITGANSSNQVIAKLYINNGSGTFTELSTSIEGVYDSFVAFSDVDNDGDQDVLITGRKSSTQSITKLYINTTCFIVPDIATLPDVTAECEVTALTVPTATSDCYGTITATHDATLPITAQGTVIVTWTYEDQDGYSITQTQNVVIEDVTGPVGDIATLADVTAECEVTALTAPTATDNCGGTVTVTNDATLPITTQGTTVVTWTYEDENGNTSTQTQNVVIEDVTAPVADVATLSDITAECEVTALTAPTATDNCGGTVTVTNDATLPITTQGTTVVTWTYEDENGNTSTQTQNVVIEDVTAPVADVATLEDITAECEVISLTAPTATDNCSATVTVTNDATLPITASTIITWTYDDGNGNTSTQTQNVVIDDVTAPVADIATLPDVIECIEVTALTAPTATDNCGGMVTVTHDATLPITTQGTTTVTWTYEDENGNTSTQTQDVVINSVDATVSVSDITLTANLSGANYQWIDCNDNNAPIAGETAQTFTALANGSYAVIVSDGTCEATSDCIVVNSVGIASLKQSEWKLYPNPTSGMFTVSANQLLDNALVEIHSADGRLIYTAVFSGTEMSFNIGNNPPGVYILRVDNKDTFRVIKN
jgi:predicted nucleotidyltransferase